jgi:hypothetical protein
MRAYTLRQASSKQVGSESSRQTDIARERERERGDRSATIRSAQYTDGQAGRAGRPGAGKARDVQMAKQYPILQL